MLACSNKTRKKDGESTDANSDVRGEGIPGAEQAKGNRNGIFLPQRLTQITPGLQSIVY